MNKYFLLLGFVVIGLASCKKTAAFNAAQQAATDDATIQAYIKANNIDSVQKTSSGLYYKIITKGTGAYPTTASTVNVNYKGILTNGNVFAPLAAAQDPLTDFIEGWQIGVPYINSGGTIELFIPSALGYGNSSPAASIPANSVLIFTITLLNFSN